MFETIQVICLSNHSISIFTSFQIEILFFISSGTQTTTFIVLSVATSSIGVQDHTTCHVSVSFFVTIQFIGE
jgi:hypothetical protein